MFLESIGSSSYWRGALYQIWIIEPNWGKELPKKDCRMLKISVLHIPHSEKAMSWDEIHQIPHNNPNTKTLKLLYNGS
jgi:hypothetical protein